MRKRNRNVVFRNLTAIVHNLSKIMVSDVFFVIFGSYCKWFLYWNETNHLAVLRGYSKHIETSSVPRVKQKLLVSHLSRSESRSRASLWSTWSEWITLDWCRACGLLPRHCWLGPPGRSTRPRCWCRCADIYTSCREKGCWHTRNTCRRRKRKTGLRVDQMKILVHLCYRLYLCSLE